MPIWQSNSSKLPLEHMTLPGSDFGLGLHCQKLIPSCRVVLKYNQNVVGCPHNIHSTIVPEGTSCLEGQYCGMQGLSQNKTVGDFFSSSTTMESSMEDISLYPITKEYGIFIME